MVLLLTIVILIISYLFNGWYTRNLQRQKLQWMGNELGLPYFGIALEIRKHTGRSVISMIIRATNSCQNGERFGVLISINMV